MEYISRTAHSRPGLSQEQALKALQGDPRFVPGTRIVSLKKQANRWVAKLEIPKEAVFPPKKDEDEDDEKSPLAEALDEGPDSDSDDDDSDDDDSDGNTDSDDSDPLDLEDKPEEEGKDESEKGELSEVLSLLHQITEALGIGKGLAEDGPPSGPKPPTPPPGGPGAGPSAPPKPKPSPRRDTPPGVSPMIGFSNKRVATFTATAEDDGTTIKQAKAELEELYSPYKVQQIKSQDGKLHALMSLR